MAYWLPYHQDSYFTNLGAAPWGQYKLRFQERDEDPPTEDRARAKLGRFSRTADRAVKRYMQKKTQRNAR